MPIAAGSRLVRVTQVMVYSGEQAFIAITPSGKMPVQNTAELAKYCKQIIDLSEISYCDC